MLHFVSPSLEKVLFSQVSCSCISSRVYIIPYSTKFSRRIIFAVFADWLQTVKIKLTK